MQAHFFVTGTLAINFYCQLGFKATACEQENSLLLFFEA
jgi:hypothetical protein